MKMKLRWSTLVLLASLSAVIFACDSKAENPKAKKSGSLTPHDLRVEYLVEPLGIDELKPRFSWKLASDVPGDVQTAYRIVVFPAPKKLNRPGGVLPPVWDSKEVEGGQSVHVEYAGEPLRPATKYEWLLKVKDHQGRESDLHTGSFSTGLFPTDNDPRPWKGNWIGVDIAETDGYRLDLDGVNWIWTTTGAEKRAMPGKASFRKTFELPHDGEPSFAVLAFTGDNAAVVSINGKEVLKSMNFKTALVTEVKALLKPGKNVVTVVANNGGANPNPAGAMGKLVVGYADGKEVQVTTDATWKAFDGEPNDVTSVDFEDSAWKNAAVLVPVGAGPWGEIRVATKKTDIPARYLRRRFHAEKSDVVRATAYVAGLGYYELYLNGQKVGDHCLDPVLHEYHARVPYVTYDVTKMVQGGEENVLGAILGNGRYYAPRRDNPTVTRDYGFPKLLCQLEIEYADGTKQLVVSDRSWKLTTDGPIRANNDYDGEIYDARKKLGVWGAADYDDSRWSAAEKVEAPRGKLRAQMMPPMRITETIRPISLNEVRPGVWIYDLGQNLVGWCRLKVEGPAGTEIRLRHAETLDPSGNGELYVANLRGAQCRDLYTTGGNGVEVYEPRFTYHGFRYVELTGFPGKPDLDTITGCVVHTDLPRVGSFECSAPIINQIHQNIFWGVRGNYLSVPTDCPQRDERQGWQGDRAAESKGEMFLFDNVTLYAKWLNDIEDSQTSNGNLSDVCPPFWPLYNSNVTWPSAFTIIPESLYLQYGDRRPIERHYDAMVRWMDHLATFIKDDLIDKDNYGDWCVPPEKPELIHSEDPARKTSKAVLATSYYIHNLDLLARYAKMLGKTADVEKFHADAKRMTDAFNKKFYDPATGKYDNGTQTSCILPLRFGLVPEGEERKVFDVLIRNIETVTDHHVGTGLIGGQWLNRVLSDRGRADLSYRFATNTDYPSWGYMVQKGATTIWELWNGDTANPAMNSGNHVMLVGDLTIWLYEYLAGIACDWEKPGFERILMKPHPVGDLTFVKCRYDSIRGPIESHWRRENGMFKWEISVPVGSTARLFVPTIDPASVRESGRTDFAKRGIHPVEFKDGRAVFDIPSGSYTFEATLK